MYDAYSHIKGMMCSMIALIVETVFFFPCFCLLLDIFWGMGKSKKHTIILNIIFLLVAVSASCLFPPTMHK